MHSRSQSTEKFEFGRSLYDASQRFETLSAGKREDYRRSFVAVCEAKPAAEPKRERQALAVSD